MKTIVLLFFYLVGFAIPTTSLAGLDENTTAPLPIMLYVSRTDCSFCHRFEKDILEPLIKSGIYKNRVTIRRLVLDKKGLVENFKGQQVSPQALADTYNVAVTPTLLFVDPAGKELAPRIVGYQKSDFYSYYLEQNIDRAIATLTGS